MVYVVRRGDANSREELVRGKARETTKCDRSPLKYPSKMKEFHDNPQSCRSFPCAVCLCVCVCVCGKALSLTFLKRLSYASHQTNI